MSVEVSGLPDPATERGLLGRLFQLDAIYVLLFSIIPGMTLVVGAIVLGIAFYTTPARAPFSPESMPGVFQAREVGFLAAPNWSVVYPLLFPLAMYFMVHVLFDIRASLDQMHDSGMVRDRAFQRSTDPTLVANWIAGNKWRRWMLVLFALITPVTVSLVEWYRNNYQRLLGVGPQARYPDYDWGLVGLMEQWPEAWRSANALFDLLAFLSQAALLAALLAFFLLLLDLERVLDRRARLVPDLSSTDTRRGFETFEEPLQQLLFVTLIAYVMCYLIRLEGVYLASTTAASLREFVVDDIVGGLVAARRKGGLSELSATLFQVPPLNRQASLGSFAAFLALFFSFAVVGMTVRAAAKRARATALDYFKKNRDGEGLFGLGIEEERRRVETMVLWPLKYLRLDLLLALAFVALFTLFFYRLGLFIFGLIMGTILYRLGKRLLTQPTTASTGSRI